MGRKGKLERIGMLDSMNKAFINGKKYHIEILKVTEAFSPCYDPFSEKQLLELLTFQLVFLLL